MLLTIWEEMRLERRRDFAGTVALGALFIVPAAAGWLFGAVGVVAVFALLLGVMAVIGLLH